MNKDPFFLLKLTRKGRLSTLNTLNMRHSAQNFVDKLARFDLAALHGAVIPDEDLARMLTRSVRTIKDTRKTPQYLRRFTELKTGIPIGNADFVENSTAHHKLIMQEMMPAALRVVADTLMMEAKTPQQHKLRMEAAKEILDRTGSLPKISRSDIHANIEHSYDDSDKASAELVAAMEGASNQTESLTEALDANRKFSKSKSLTPQEQEYAMSELEKLQSNLGLDETYDLPENPTIN